jgi:hypothetical protein
LKTTYYSEVDTPDGAGVLSKIYISDLGLVMGKVFIPKKNVWINYQLTKLEHLIDSHSKIRIKRKVESLQV